MGSDMQPWRWINFCVETGPLQMAIDEILLRNFAAKNRDTRLEGIVRFYDFVAPAMTFGFFQKAASLPSSLSRLPYTFVRRITAGGLVNHDVSLTFSLISHRQSQAAFARISSFYHAFHTIIRDAFATLNINLEWKEAEAPSLRAKRSNLGSGIASASASQHLPRNDSFILEDDKDPCKKKTDVFQQCFIQPVEHDLLWKGRKIVGGAQKRVGEFFLHQGAIALKPLDVDTVGASSVLQKRIALSIRTQMEKVWGISFRKSSLTAEENGLARQLAEEKYETLSWRNKFV